MGGPIRQLCVLALRRLRAHSSAACKRTDLLVSKAGSDAVFSSKGALQKGCVQPECVRVCEWVVEEEETS